MAELKTTTTSMVFGSGVKPRTVSKGTGPMILWERKGGIDVPIGPANAVGRVRYRGSVSLGGGRAVGLDPAISYAPHGPSPAEIAAAQNRASIRKIDAEKAKADAKAAEAKRLRVEMKLVEKKIDKASDHFPLAKNRLIRQRNELAERYNVKAAEVEAHNRAMERNWKDIEGRGKKYGMGEGYKAPLYVEVPATVSAMKKGPVGARPFGQEARGLAAESKRVLFEPPKFLGPAHMPVTQKLVGLRQQAKFLETEQRKLAHQAGSLHTAGLVSQSFSEKGYKDYEKAVLGYEEKRSKFVKKAMETEAGLKEFQPYTATAKRKALVMEQAPWQAVSEGLAIAFRKPVEAFVPKGAEFTTGLKVPKVFDFPVGMARGFLGLETIAKGQYELGFGTKKEMKRKAEALGQLAGEYALIAGAIKVAKVALPKPKITTKLYSYKYGKKVVGFKGYGEVKGLIRKRPFYIEAYAKSMKKSLSPQSLKAAHETAGLKTKAVAKLLEKGETQKIGLLAEKAGGYKIVSGEALKAPSVLKSQQAFYSGRIVFGKPRLTSIMFSPKGPKELQKLIAGKGKPFAHIDVSATLPDKKVARALKAIPERTTGLPQVKGIGIEEIPFKETRGLTMTFSEREKAMASVWQSFQAKQQTFLRGMTEKGTRFFTHIEPISFEKMQRGVFSVKKPPTPKGFTGMITTTKQQQLLTGGRKLLPAGIPADIVKAAGAGLPPSDFSSFIAGSYSQLSKGLGRMSQVQIQRTKAISLQAKEAEAGTLFEPPKQTPLQKEIGRVMARAPKAPKLGEFLSTPELERLKKGFGVSVGREVSKGFAAGGVSKEMEKEALLLQGLSKAISPKAQSKAFGKTFQEAYSRMAKGKAIELEKKTGKGITSLIGVSEMRRESQRRAVALRAITRTKTEFKPLEEVKMKPPTLRVPWLPRKKPSLKKQAARLEKGFEVFARRQKKVFKLSEKALTKKQALGLGAAWAMKGAGVSFKLKPTEKLVRTTKGDDVWSKAKKQFRLGKGGFFLERKKYRIDMPGEKKEITQKGLETLLKFPELRKKKRKKKRGKNKFSLLF